MSIAQLRQEYHNRICKENIRIRPHKKNEIGYPNFADIGNEASMKIAWGIVNRLSYTADYESIYGQTSGDRFQIITRDFLEKSFELLHHLRPGKWGYSTLFAISVFDQYQHLANLEKIVEENSELASSLGIDYIVKPDIVIGRWPVSDEEINRERELINAEDSIAKLTPIREVNSKRLILHASISCKWTLRSDRAQNARLEALNLIRNRKGSLPHVVAVTAEPLPTRIASLALGTGDLDCVYHFALPELQEAISEIVNEDQLDMLITLIEGRRLRDISDLPFDLAI